MTDKKQKLTRKQEAFVREYLIDLNGTQAAIRAGYSKRTAHKIATENLHKPAITAALQKKMDKRAEKTEISSDFVLTTIRNTIKTLVDSDDEKNARNIFKGCELLGKHLKLFTDKVEQETTVTIVKKEYDGN